MKMAEEGVRPAIDKFQSEVFSREGEEIVVAHTQGVFGAIAGGIPGVDGGHGARIRRDDRGKRELAMAVFATASRDC